MRTHVQGHARVAECGAAYPPIGRARTRSGQVAVLNYSIVTPVRDEAETLPRLAAALASQTQLPQRWVIVESGSRDETAAVAETIVATYPWARLVTVPPVGEAARGAPIVRSIHTGLKSLELQPDILVNVDADVTMNPDYFERLVGAFTRDPTLGIASGSAWEPFEGGWRQRFVTGSTVWGATRAYRWACLQSVLPLEERHGWDGADYLKARARGWQTRTLVDLPFWHHRPEGVRDGSRWAHWLANGDTAYFMGYRPSYLVFRTLYRIRSDRAACALLVGYAAAALKRSPRLEPAARDVLRRDQRLRKILDCRREAHGFGRARGGSGPPSFLSEIV